MPRAFGKREEEEWPIHVPSEHELLKILGDATVNRRHWNSLRPVSATDFSRGFEERLKAALLRGGFRRVDPNQLTRGITRDDFYRSSVLGLPFPTATVPMSRRAMNQEFLTVHHTPEALQFGVIEPGDGQWYFRQEPGNRTVLASRHWSWPACDAEGVPPVRALIFWRN